MRAANQTHPWMASRADDEGLVEEFKEEEEDNDDDEGSSSYADEVSPDASDPD